MSLLSKEQSHIWTIENPHEEKFLRTPVPEFDMTQATRKELEELVVYMRRMMTHGHGVGLSANQIGLPVRMFVAQLPSQDGREYVGKFYALFNPRIVRISDKKNIDQEGCLSVPGLFGDMERNNSLTLTATNKQNKKVSVSVRGYLARIMQHEIDHLNGILFTDSAKNIQKLS